MHANSSFYLDAYRVPGHTFGLHAYSTNAQGKRRTLSR
jgi:hypothetical protein